MNHSLFASLLLVALLPCASHAADPADAQRAKDARIVFALSRLSNVDVSSNPQWKASVLRYLESIKGTDRYLQLVDRFGLKETRNELLRIAQEASDSNLGVSAARLLIKFDERALLVPIIDGKDEAQAIRIIQTLGLVGDARTNEWLQPLMSDGERTLGVRSASTAAIGRNGAGQRYLLQLVERGKLSDDLKFAAANALLGSPDQRIRAEAAKYLKLPAAGNQEPLPPIADLLKLKGDANRGKLVFQNQGTCAKCHKLSPEGKDVGPALTEIASKLSTDAMYISILDPNAGISHSYETYVVATNDGNVVQGLLVSETPQTVTLKTAEDVVRTFPRADIDEFKRQAVSLMPANLQQLMTKQDLVDLIEFLTTLKKPG